VIGVGYWQWAQKHPTQAVSRIGSEKLIKLTEAAGGSGALMRRDGVAMGRCGEDREGRVRGVGVQDGF